MTNKPPYGMPIRLSKEVYETLLKLKEEQDLPSMAAAIKFWVEQEASKRREAELLKLKRAVSDLTQAVDRSVRRLDNLERDFREGKIIPFSTDEHIK